MNYRPDKETGSALLDRFPTSDAVFVEVDTGGGEGTVVDIGAVAAFRIVAVATVSSVARADGNTDRLGVNWLVSTVAPGFKFFAVAVASRDVVGTPPGEEDSALGHAPVDFPLLHQFLLLGCKGTELAGVFLDAGLHGGGAT